MMLKFLKNNKLKMSVFLSLQTCCEPKVNKMFVLRTQEKLVSSNMLTFCENDSFIYHRKS